MYSIVCTFLMLIFIKIGWECVTHTHACTRLGTAAATAAAALSLEPVNDNNDKY